MALWRLFPEAFEAPYGAPPDIRAFPDYGAITSWVADRIRNLSEEEGYPLSEMAVIYAMKTPENDPDMNLPLLIGKALDKRGLLHNWISEDYRAKRSYDVTTENVTISTIHSVKGFDKRPSDLCPCGEDIQVIAVHVTLVTFPSRGFPEDLDFFQLRHKRGRRLVGYVEPLSDLGDGNRGCIEQLLQNPDGYRGGDLFLSQQTAMIGLEFEDLPGRIHRGAGDVHNPFQEIIHPLFIIARLPNHVQTIVVFLAIFLK